MQRRKKGEIKMNQENAKTNPGTVCYKTDKGCLQVGAARKTDPYTVTLSLELSFDVNAASEEEASKRTRAYLNSHAVRILDKAEIRIRH
jgi:hypothetical protein